MERGRLTRVGRGQLLHDLGDGRGILLGVGPLLARLVARRWEARLLHDEATNASGALLRLALARSAWLVLGPARPVPPMETRQDWR